MPRGQVVHHIQELELGSVDEHDATILLRRVDIFVLGHERNKVLADELEIVVARVEAQHRHLVDPLQDLLALRLRDAVNVWKPELVYHIRSNCLNSPGSLEAMYSGSGFNVSAMETEMGTCSLSKERSRVGQAALLLSWYDSKS